MEKRTLFGRVAIALVALSLFLYFVYFGVFSARSTSNVEAPNELRILAYSSFNASWGPGPRLVEMFEEKMRQESDPAAGLPGAIKVILLQAEDSGLLLAKLAAFPADLVIGFDQQGKALAARERKWRAHGVQNALASDEKFLAFDWAPIGFIYRKSEVDPPHDFNDLLHARFKNSLALQDPRSSSPGYQFLLWLVREMGEDEAFRYLEKLKPNVQSMSGSWSQSYGLFTRGLAKIVFSYATSVLYHQISEKDEHYAFAELKTSRTQSPVQIEYASISEQCQNCELAKKFVKFLSGTAAQSVIMHSNWMLPMNKDTAAGTPFAELYERHADALRSSIDLRTSTNEENFSARLLKRWREVGL